MVDHRIQKTADLLVNYSTEVKECEYVQIIFDHDAFPLAKEVYKSVILKKAYPSMKCRFPELTKFFLDNSTDWQLTREPKEAMYEMKNTDVVIYIGGESNTKELTNTDPNKMSMRQKSQRKLGEERLKKRWVLFEYPTNALAQDAEMSLEEFEDFVYNATLIDWKKTEDRLKKLKAIVDSTNIVRIRHTDTDLQFSIKRRNARYSIGKRNMPDGEVFTAPIEDSTNGFIKYSFPAIYGGREVGGVYLEFKDGKVVNSSAEKNNEFLKQMLSTDNGASVLGEFGIGMNPNITRFVKQILFDEKILGTIHLALGNAYPECKGENVSAIHWDMIKDLRDNGELYFDGKLVQKSGKWLIDF